MPRSYEPRPAAPAATPETRTRFKPLERHTLTATSNHNHRDPPATQPAAPARQPEHVAAEFVVDSAIRAACERCGKDRRSATYSGRESVEHLIPVFHSAAADERHERGLLVAERLHGRADAERLLHVVGADTSFRAATQASPN